MGVQPICNPAAQDSAFNLDKTARPGQTETPANRENHGDGGQGGKRRILPYKQEVAGSSPAPPTTRL